VDGRLALTAAQWRRDTLRRLAHQLRAHGRHQVTVAEALVLLDAEPASLVEALLLDLVDRRERRASPTRSTPPSAAC
jgi:hypothetical protein